MHKLGKDQQYHGFLIPLLRNTNMLCRVPFFFFDKGQTAAGTTYASNAWGWSTIICFLGLLFPKCKPLRFIALDFHYFQPPSLCLSTYWTHNPEVQWQGAQTLKKRAREDLLDKWRDFRCQSIYSPRLLDISLRKSAVLTFRVASNNNKPKTHERFF